MSDDVHPAIKWQATADGWGEHDDVSPEAFSILQQVKAVLSTPNDRVNALRAFDQLIGDDSTGSLKSRAELLNVRRSISTTHERLLKACR